MNAIETDQATIDTSKLLLVDLYYYPQKITLTLEGCLGPTRLELTGPSAQQFKKQLDAQEKTLATWEIGKDKKPKRIKNKRLNRKRK